MIESINGKTIYDFLGTAIVKSEREIFNFINTNLSDTIYILYINNNYNTKFKTLFVNPKFLSVLNQVLIVGNEQHRLTEYDLIYINTILYWYIVNHSSDWYIKMLWYMIADNINKETIYKLRILNLFDTELCNFLAIAYKSSAVESTRIRNVNFTICTSSVRVLDIKEFESIYNNLYNRNFTALILNLLFDDSIPSIFYGNENSDRGKKSLANNTNAIYAGLFILERFNPFDIARILRLIYNTFANEYNYDSERMRVSFKKLSKETFPNILIALEAIEKEQIYLP
ncbi:MAG: hypothetical protein IJ193_00795 [Bacilli bacterium]|nr:hypothetical protein [Bacilli bacterium]